MKRPLISILTPACWERAEKVRTLRDELHSQIIQHPASSIEHLILLDNRARSIGMKRQSLLDSARGDFIAFVDDDDDVSEDYITRLIEAIIQHPEADVITFDQSCSYNDKPFTVHFQHGAADQLLDLAGPDHQRITRGPWHVCAWRRSKIQHCQFLDSNYGEDKAWVDQARLHVQRSHHIDAILHTYRHHATQTLAPEPLTPTSP
jgi:glycosyltransferase involved in cell wall biosynthesis